MAVPRPPRRLFSGLSASQRERATAAAKLYYESTMFFFLPLQTIVKCVCDVCVCLVEQLGKHTYIYIIYWGIQGGVAVPEAQPPPQLTEGHQPLLLTQLKVIRPELSGPRAAFCHQDFAFIRGYLPFATRGREALVGGCVCGEGVVFAQRLSLFHFYHSCDGSCSCFYSC